MSDYDEHIGLLQSLVDQKVHSITVNPTDLRDLWVEFKRVAEQNAALKERNEQLFAEANRAELTIQDLRARLNGTI